MIDPKTHLINLDLFSADSQTDEKASIVRDAAIYNVEAYNNPVLVSMICCGKPVRICPTLSYVLVKNHTTETVDSWGYPYKP